MSMEITNNYSNYTSAYANAANSRKQTAESKAAAQTGSIGEAGLSKGAQALLEKLRKSYGDMDFMVADFDKGDNAKDILSRGTKEVSVIFSSSELEKMASDEKSAIQATKEALYDLEHPRVYTPRSIEVQQARIKEGEFYRAFLEKLERL